MRSTHKYAYCSFALRNVHQACSHINSDLCVWSRCRHGHRMDSAKMEILLIYLQTFKVCTKFQTSCPQTYCQFWYSASRVCSFKLLRRKRWKIAYIQMGYAYFEYTCLNNNLHPVVKNFGSLRRFQLNYLGYKTIIIYTYIIL